MTSSVDPSAEIAAILARLNSLTGVTYEGIEQGTELPVNAFGKKVGYRDFQPGSVIPASGQRLLGAPTQAQPHIWAFQVSHYGSTRNEATQLSIETDKSLIGWAPSENAGEIGTFYFTTYDNFAKNGESVGWIATRFYECELGQTPDFTL